MLNAILNLLIGCRHRKLTRPITPVHNRTSTPADTYVVCLDCGQHFKYDVREMRMGEAVPKSAARPDPGQFQTSN